MRVKISLLETEDKNIHIYFSEFLEQISKIKDLEIGRNSEMKDEKTARMGLLEITTAFFSSIAVKHFVKELFVFIKKRKTVIKVTKANGDKIEINSNNVSSKEVKNLIELISKD